MADLMLLRVSETSRFKAVDRGLDQRPAAFRAQDEGRADLAEFDHVRRLQDAVHQSQAGIRHVVQDATAAQSQAVMDAASRGRFQVVAAHGAVDQGPDLAPVEPRGVDRQFAAFDALVAGQDAGLPEPPLADSAHQLEPALRQTQSPIQRLQPPLDLFAADRLVRQAIADGFETNVLVLHG